MVEGPSSPPFGRLLRRVRVAAGLTQEGLAERAGLSVRTVSDLERGEIQAPRQDTLELLVEALALRTEDRTQLEAAVRRARPERAAPDASAPVGPPNGTVAFLFTDIEGSTQLWQEQHAAMEQALARHDTLLRQAIIASGGHVFKTMGDAVYASFTTASAALDAALAGQQALLAESWSPACPIRVRMAVHVGAVQERGGDYVGPATNRITRVLAAAHGGQVLLSDVAAGLVRDDLPPGVQLQDLGEHRLKDLIRPEHLFQVMARGLPQEFPALRTLATRPNNLPMQPTPLIGREREVAAVGHLVLHADVRVVTLTGPGGVGKTRLALQVAAEVLDAFADGVFVVSLAPVSDPALVLPTIAQVLGVTEVAGEPMQATLTRVLDAQHRLLVLDNFEQVLDAAVEVNALLAACRHVRALVTSRASLRIGVERIYPVPPLSLPRRSARPALDVLSQYEAIRLFIARAQDVQPDFVITNATAPAVAEICARLDGLPLAIELAAARVRLLPPDALLARLEHRLKIVTSGRRDLPARQQTLRATIDWSYSLLDEGEQALFARLGVFVGGRTLDAIAAVCNADDDLPVDVLDAVESLLDKSLLRHEDDMSVEPRFVMLETIHEYAREQLAMRGERDAMEQAHALYFLTLAEDAESELRGPAQAVWLRRLEKEHDNLRAALRWAHDSGRIDIGLRLVNALWRFWLMRTYLGEGLAAVEMLLAHAGQAQVEKAVRAKSFDAAGVLAANRADIGRAYALFTQSLDVYTQSGDAAGRADVLSHLGLIVVPQGDYDHAVDLFEQSLAIHRQRDNRRGIATVLGNLAELARFRSEFQQARAYAEEAFVLEHELNDEFEQAASISTLASVLTDLGEYEHAYRLFEEHAKLCRSVESTMGMILGADGLARLLVIQGHAARAAQLLGAVAAQREKRGVPRLLPEEVTYNSAMSMIRRALGDHALEEAWAEGQILSLEEAIDAALQATSLS